jgi:hypothetical protein
MAAGPPDAPDSSDSVLFGYVVPFLGVVLVALGIGAAVTGGYAILEARGGSCGEPTIAVTSPAASERYVDSPLQLPRLPFESLAPAEQAAFREALADPVGEAEVSGPFPNAGPFTNGTLVAFEGDQYYTTVVAENTCFSAPPLQFPLGLLALGLGTVAILTPPAYRKLVSLETGADWRVRSGDERSDEQEAERGASDDADDGTDRR